MKTRRRTLLPALVALGLMATTAGLEAQEVGLRLRGIAVIPDVSSEIATIGGDVDIGNAYVPELDISVYFNPNVSLELILATAKHELDALDTSLGDVDLGHVWLLPPTLTLQWHFLPDEMFNPYVGAGVNFTLFYNEDPGAVTSVDYDNALGFGFQAGFDYMLNDNWGLNVDGKKLFLNTDATVDAGGTVVVADVDINPWILGAGIVYRIR